MVIDGAPRAPWAVSHAALPIADARAGTGDVRVYISARDQHGRAQIGYADWDPTAGGPADRFSPAPVLGLGELGSFDDSGVTSSCVVTQGGRKYL